MNIDQSDMNAIIIQARTNTVHLTRILMFCVIMSLTGIFICCIFRNWYSNIIRELVYSITSQNTNMTADCSRFSALASIIICLDYSHVFHILICQHSTFTYNIKFVSQHNTIWIVLREVVHWGNFLREKELWHESSLFCFETRFRHKIIVVYCSLLCGFATTHIVSKTVVSTFIGFGHYQKFRINIEWAKAKYTKFE